MTFRIVLLPIVILTAQAFGCAAPRNYIYGPAENVTAEINSFPAARYDLPVERPEGVVRVASFGVTELQPTAGGPVFPVIAVRLIASNNGDDVPWTIDTQAAQVEIAHEGLAGPVYVNSDIGTLPVIDIARGQQRTVDLYFPLPGPIHNEDGLAGFDFKWQIQTGARLNVERTPFQRLLAEPQTPPPTAVVGVGVGWGPIWWHDPYYRRPGLFVHPSVIVVPRYRHTVIVHRPGAVYYAAPAHRRRW